MRAPDLTAPRYRQKFYNVRNLGFIKKFREKYPQYSEYSDDLIKDVLWKQCQGIQDAVISTRDGVELQGGMGRLFMGLIPPRKKKRKIAWKQSVELGVTVYHKNWETDGKSVKIFYTSYFSQYRFEFRKIWKFSPVRQFSRSVAANCAKYHKIYHHVDDYRNVWDMLNKKNYADRAKRNTTQALKVYNEFDLE